MGRRTIYAIVETGGKQYKAEPGQTLRVERLEAPKGTTVELPRVLLVARDEETLVGKPTVLGAKVVATSQGEVPGEKIIVFKFKPKVRYRRKQGHRQRYTQLLVKEIVLETAAEPKAPRSRRTPRAAKKETEDGS